MSTEGPILERTTAELKRRLEEEASTCPVCQVVAENVQHYLEALFYERVNDPDTRDEIREAGGFCRYHAALIAQQRDALGTAIILKDILSHDIERLKNRTAVHTSAWDQLKRSMSISEPPARGSAREHEVQCPPCPICTMEAEQDSLVVDSLLDALAARSFLDVFRRSRGLCVHHCNLALDRAGSEEQQTMVADVEVRALSELTEQLAELARKHDYRFAQEPHGDEMRSWLRALNVASSWLET